MAATTLARSAPRRPRAARLLALPAGLALGGVPAISGHNPAVAIALALVVGMRSWHRP